MDDLKMATDAAADARKNFERARQQLADEEKRLAEARAAAAKASLACRKANPEHSSFEKTVLERANADARVDAFEQRCVDARAEVEAAKARAREASVAADQAELMQIKARIDEDDRAILKMII